MFFKMENHNSHPYAFMALFVKEYCQIMKPFLEEGDLETAKAGIPNLYWRYLECIKENGKMLNVNLQAVVRYEESLTLLNGLCTEKRLSETAIKRINSQISRDVSELDIILQGGPIFDEYKQGAVF